MDETTQARMRHMVQSLPQRREVYMKKKIKAALLVAALLLALAATALAVAVSQGFLKDAGELELSSDYYNGWTLAEKESMARLMIEDGVLDDPAPWEEALALRRDAEREAALDALFASRYGGPYEQTGLISVRSIMEDELGDFDSSWSLEQKARYSEIMLEFDLLGYDTDLYFMPGEDVITPEAAIAIARQAVEEAFGLEPGEMDGVDTEINYTVHRAQANVLPPYYEVVLSGDGWRYDVGVTGEGEVLSSTDGYDFVESPAEQAAYLAAYQASDEVSSEQVLNEHIASLAQIQAETAVTWANCLADNAISLADGTVLIGGRNRTEEGTSSSAFILNMDEEGPERWRLTFEGDEEGERVYVSGLMQLDDGDILAIIRREMWGEKQAFVYAHYDQVRLSPDGELLETRRLASASEMLGTYVEFDAFYMVTPGHDGMLVGGVVGDNNIVFYIQLDEAGEPVFTLSFEELRGYAAYLYTIPQGYVLVGWNAGISRPILRWYDRQGQKVSEPEIGEDLTGLRITEVQGEADGSLIVTSHFTENEQVLARIGADGTLLSKWTVSNGSGTVADATESVSLADGYACANMHRSAQVRGTHHLGLLVGRMDGSAQEYHISGVKWADTITVELIPIGQDKLALIYSAYDEANSNMISMHAVIFEQP